MAGCPYTAGDPILVEVDGALREAQVHLVVPAAVACRAFGQRWSLVAFLDDADLAVAATVDDDGRNRRIGQRVSPSAKVTA